MNIEILSFPAYEETIRVKLEQCRKLIQSVVDQFVDMGMGPVLGVSGLYELLFNPKVVYEGKVAEMMSVPDDIEEKLKDKFLQDLKTKIPSPDRLYSLAEKAKLDPYSIRELNYFDVIDNKVVLSREASRRAIKAKSVFGTKIQQEFYKDLEKFVKDLNTLNKRTGGKLLINSTRSLSDVFGIPERGEPGVYNVTILDNGLRQLLKDLK